MHFLMRKELRDLAQRFRLAAEKVLNLRTEEDFQWMLHYIRTIETILLILKKLYQERIVELAHKDISMYEAEDSH